MTKWNSIRPRSLMHIHACSNSKPKIIPRHSTTVRCKQTIFFCFLLYIRFWSTTVCISYIVTKIYNAVYSDVLRIRQSEINCLTTFYVFHHIYCAFGKFIERFRVPTHIFGNLFQDTIRSPPWLTILLKRLTADGKKSE